jgi:hypothetical protein
MRSSTHVSLTSAIDVYILTAPVPRLTKQLFNTDIFIRIGGTSFQIPRDTFSAPGDSPNYFSLGFAQWFSTPSEVFPGLDRNALLRPPSISPPSVPNKSGETFGELIRVLQGYNVEIRNDVHRSQLLRDARYFHLKGLEQRLIPHEISYNLARQQSEILIRLEDIRQSGISFTPDSAHSSSETTVPITTPKSGFVSYARPYTNDAETNHSLILETSSSESTTLSLPTSSSSSSDKTVIDARATFHADTLRRITALFGVIASKMGLPATQPFGLMHMQTGSGMTSQSVTPANSGVSETKVRVRINSECALYLDGVPAEYGIDAQGGVGIKRDGQWTRFRGGSEENSNTEVEWVVKRAHWRIRVEPVGDEGRMQVILCGVKIEALTSQRHRNSSRGFLGSA